MNDNLRIAMVAACPFPYPRGTPVRINRMAQALSEMGHDVHVITYHLGMREQKSPFNIHRIPNLNFYRKNNPGPSLIKLMVVDPILMFKVLSLYKKYKFDVIHAHHVEGLLVALPLRMITRIPIIFDMHTLLSTELPYYQLYLKKPWLKNIGRVFDIHLPKLADHVITVTDEIKKSLLKNYAIPGQKVSIIPNGIELEHYSMVESLHNKASGNDIVLGYAGNFASYQGIDIMLEALGKLAQIYPRICLYLYSNDSIDPYKPLIKKLGIGPQIKIFSSDFKSLPEQLAQTDILLNPRPDGAGQPLKVLNYMAAGKPIVSMAGSGHFLSHGENGWIIAGDRSQAFADGIMHIADNRTLAEGMGRNAKKFVMHNYSWRSRAEDIIKIYSKLVRAKK